MKWIIKTMIAAFLCISAIACGRNTQDETMPSTEPTGASSQVEKESKDVEIVSKYHTFRTQNISEGLFDWDKVEVISGVAELTEYRKAVEDVLSREIDEVTLRDFRKLADSYDADWFRTKMLLVIPIKHSNWDYDHAIRLFRESSKNCLNVVVSAKRPEQEVYPSEACWFMLIEVETVEIQGISEMHMSVETLIDESKRTLTTQIKTTTGVEGGLAPIVVHSTEELRKICKEKYERFQTVDDIWMPEELQVYSNEWFENGDLVLVYVLDSVKGFTYDVRAVWDEVDQMLELDVFRCIRSDGVLFEQIFGQLLVIEIPNMEVGDDAKIKVEKIEVILPKE